MQIDWLTVAAQIANFLVLVWLLQRFLYRPISDAMRRRETGIKDRRAEAEAAREDAEREAARLREDRDALAAQKEAILQEARDEAEKSRERLRDELRAEMERERRSWRRRLAQEREDFARRMQRQAGRRVLDIAERVLRDFADDDLSARVSESFAERLRTLDEDARAKLAEAARRADGPARVASGRPLSPTARGRVTRAVHDALSKEIELDYQEDDDLLLGIRLIVGEQTVEWSASRHLKRLETALDEILDAEARRGRDDEPHGGDIGGPREGDEAEARNGADRSPDGERAAKDPGRRAGAGA